MHKAIRNVRNLLLLTAACLYFDAGQTSILASPPLCETVCTGAVACNETCYETMLDFDTDNPTTCGAMEVSCCGDDLCNGDTEEVDSCEVDCGDPVSSPPDCNPHTQSGCAAGEMCTYLGKCVDANGRDCQDFCVRGVLTNSDHSTPAAA